jgi:two-component system, OmpR family, response regulator
MQDHGFQAVGLSRLADAYRVLARREASFIVLYLRGDHNRALSSLSEIKARSNIPVMVIIGSEAIDSDRAAALEAGADDCLAMPVCLRELVARIRAILRRSQVRDGVRRPIERANYRFAGWQLDPCRRRLTDPEGAPVRLSVAQYALLIAFLEACQRPLTMEQLKRTVGRDGQVTDRSVITHISRLRQKLEVDPRKPALIKTNRGMGYVFTSPVEAACSASP